RRCRSSIPGCCVYLWRLSGRDFQYYCSCPVFINAKLRFIPENFALFIGLSLNISRKPSAVISFQSVSEKFKTAEMGFSSGWECGFENLFQGQTSWQASQPNIQLSILGRIFSG